MQRFFLEAEDLNLNDPKIGDIVKFIWGCKDIYYYRARGKIIESNAGRSTGMICIVDWLDDNNKSIKTEAIHQDNLILISPFINDANLVCKKNK